MRSRLLLLGIALVILSFAAVGCGGGGGGGVSFGPGVALNIGADTAYMDGRQGVHAKSTVGSPLESGAQIAVYDFPTRQVITTGTLDANGWCHVDAPAGSTVAVVISGTRDRKSYRLSTIVPVVPIDGGEYVLDPSTSITAEAIAQKHFGRSPIDQGTFNQIYLKAANYIGSRPDADSSIGGLILGHTFGAQGSLNQKELQSIIDAVPGTIDNKIVNAKNAVQQIKEAGTPLELMLAQERPDIEEAFSADLETRYRDLYSRLGVFMLPAMFGGMEYIDPDNNHVWPTVFDLQMGKGYTAVYNEEAGNGWSEEWFELSDNPSLDTPGQITIQYVTKPNITPSGTYTIVAKRNGPSWIVTQTFTGDASQQYTITIPALAEDPGENPTIPVGINMQDTVFTTPLTFNGTITAAGRDRSNYTQIALDGTLSTAEISASGRFQASFPSSLPEGADPDNDEIYDFPTGISISNADIKLTNGSTIISVTGNISANMTTRVVNGRPKLVLKHIESNGDYSNSSTGLKFTGSTSADWANAPEPDASKATGSFKMHGGLTREGRPSYLTDVAFTVDSGQAKGTVDLRAGASTLSGSATGAFASDGSLQSSTLTLKNQNGVQINIQTDQSQMISGDIVVLKESVADIRQTGSTIRVTYHSEPPTYEDIHIKSPGL